MTDMSTQAAGSYYTGADSETVEWAQPNDGTVDWRDAFLGRLAEAARRHPEPETVQVSKLLWEAAQASAAQDRAVIARQAEQIEALRAEVLRLQGKASLSGSLLTGLPANALRYSR